MTRKTQTQEWIALGYRHDDVNLWEELCIWIDAQPGKCAYESQLPRHLYYLILKSKENAYTSWLYDNFLMPIFYKTGSGWRLKLDWRDRIAIMRDPALQKLINWLATLQDIWYESNILAMKPRGDDFDRIYCHMCSQEYQATFSLVYLTDDLIKRLKHNQTCGMTKIQARIETLMREHPDLTLPAFKEGRMTVEIQLVDLARRAHTSP